MKSLKDYQKHLYKVREKKALLKEIGLVFSPIEVYF